MNDPLHPITLEQTVDQVDEWAVANLPIKPDSKPCIELPYCLEGDRWQLQLQRSKRRYQLTGRKLLVSSPERQPHRCIHFEHCGGCQWQHLSATALLQRKEQFVRRLLAEALEPDTVWHTAQLSPQLWRYRNKMEYSFGQSKDGQQRQLGLHQTRFRIIDLQQCPIAPDWFEKALEATRTWWQHTGLQAYYHPRDEGSLRQLCLRQASGGRMAVLTVSGNPNYALRSEQIESFKQALLNTVEPGVPLSLFVTLQQCISSQPTRWFEMHLNGPDAIIEHLTIDLGDGPCHFEFSISPTTFFQPNTEGAQLLYESALRMLRPQPNWRVWDLFCGSGTLAIIASRWSQQVVGVEVNPMALLDAQANALRNGATNVRFEQSDLHKAPKACLQKLLESGRPDAIFVDPPRAGLLDLGSRLLGEIAATHLVYISCNPRSQARDIACLRSYGYRLRQVSVIDQFPQTGHVEVVALLERP